MSKSGQREKKKKWIRILIFLFIIGILAIAGYYYINYRREQQTAETIKNLQTVIYTKGELSASISGTGTVQANQQAILSWYISGEIGNINAHLGKIVEKGEVLMSLNEENLPIEILQAQIDVTTIEKTLEDLYENNSLQLAQAEFDLIQSQKQLDDAIQERRIMNYGRCADERVQELQEEYDDALELHKLFATDATLAAVDIALANLNFCKADYTDEEIQEAEAKVTLLEEQVNNLEKQILSLKNGPDPDDVNVLETQLEIAKARIEYQTITAPFKSTVTGIYLKEGDQVSAGTKAVQIADLLKLYIDVQISEVDIPLVKLGQDVEMVFDAYFEETYTGLVVEISPTGTESQGVVTYNVKVILLDGLDIIKPGMTAAVNIITDRKEGVFLIPSSALATIDGKDIVYVMRNSKPIPVEVIVGAYSSSLIEVVEADIQEGEVIVINPPVSVLSVMDSDSRVPFFIRNR